MTASITLTDGRRVDYFLDELAGDLLVYHHGTPAAGPLDPQMVAAARAHGFALVELVRPGYGESTRQSGRTVADVVPLVASLADYLGADRFVTFGWSGGGPHALATAALMPQRCAGAVSLASIAPYEASGLDFLAGMGADNIAEFGAALTSESALEEFLTEGAAGLKEVTAAEVVDAMRSLLPAVDQAHVDGAAGDALAAELRWSVAHGIWGWFDDDMAFCKPWGFDLGTMAVPVQIWQGSDDLMVPYDHGQWLAAHVSGATVELREGEGHLSLAETAMGEGFAWLRAQFDA
jgi:pimeloyl-ACP methyl ester carboxylesterase